MKRSKKTLKPQSKRKTKDKRDKLPDNVLEHVPHDLRLMVANGVKKYLDILGMANYKYRILYAKSNPTDDSSYEMCGEEAIAASTDVNMRYLRFDLRVYPFLVDQWKNGYFSDEDVKEIIAHEVAHVVTNHLYRIAVSVFKSEEETRDTWESLTTLVGRLLNDIEDLQGDLTNRK